MRQYIYRIVYCSIFVTLFLALPLVTYASVTITVDDLSSGIMRVTYVYTMNNSGQTSDVYGASDGFSFASGPISVISVIDSKADIELEYELIEAENGGEALKVYYMNPGSREKTHEIKITMEASTDDIYKDDEDRWVVKYVTAHIAFFIIPEDHAIVYCNFPILIYEKSGRTVVRIDHEKPSPYGIYHGPVRESDDLIIKLRDLS